MDNPKLLEILERQFQRREDLATQNVFPPVTVESCTEFWCALNPYARVIAMYGYQVYDHVSRNFWWSRN